MEITKFYNMRDYCISIKEYLDTYNSNETIIGLYGDKVQELNEIVTDEKMESMKFIVCVTSIVGAVTRVLRGYNKNLPFLDWIGTNDESFSKDYFNETMKNIWPELYN